MPVPPLLRSSTRDGRIRRRVKGSPAPDEYAFKVKRLQKLEKLSEAKRIDLFYGDECGVSLLPCVPYGWCFKDEQVSIPSTSGKGVNCFALLARENRCFFRTTQENIDATTVCDYWDQFSQALPRSTVVVLDNAPLHNGMMKKRRESWEARGLHVLFLPVYSPQRNIAAILWRKLKTEKCLEGIFL